MALDLPSLAEVRGLSRDFLASRLVGSDGLPANSRARVLSDSNAALAFGAYQYIDELARQFLPDAATGVWLDRWADIWLGGRHAATFAQGVANVTGDQGTILPLATPLAGGGQTFETTEEITIGAGLTPVSVRAISAGAAGNLGAGSSLSILSAIVGLDGTAIVVTLSGGVDVESDDLLRDRILARIRKPPMGGDADDYVAWAREVPGVTRAWCSPHEMGPGSVTVRFMMDDLRADNDGFPTIQDVALVQAHIDESRPVAVQDCFVFAPVAQPVNVTINGLVPNTAATRAAVVAALNGMLRDRAAPARAVNGSRIPAQTIHEEWISAAILDAPGVDHFDLATGDQVMSANGKLAVLGTVTFGV